MISQDIGISCLFGGAAQLIHYLLLVLFLPGPQFNRMNGKYLYRLTEDWVTLTQLSSEASQACESLLQAFKKPVEQYLRELHFWI